MTDRVAVALALTLGGLVLAATSGDGAYPTRMILLVTVDTLRADRLGAYGSPLGLTPRLDALAAEGHLFTRAFAPAPFTLPSVAAIMTGRYPEELTLSGNADVVPRATPRLAGALRDRGWTTGAVVGNYVLRRRAGLARGFDEYDARFAEREAARNVPERRAAATTDAALEMLDRLSSRRRPAFLWVHYQDPHGPYVPPASHRARTLAHETAAEDGRRELPVSPTHTGQGALPRYQQVEGRRQVGFYRAGYNGEVALADEQIGRLLDGVDERGLLDGAVVVFTSDHGESLGEDDHWFAHGERLSEALVRVPLIVRTPGRGAARRDDLASLLDVFPTLAGIVHAEPPRSLRGRDLFSDAPAPSAVYFSALSTSKEPRHGIATGAVQYVRWEDADGAHEQLYRLDDDGFAPAAADLEVLRVMRGRLTQERASIEAGDAEPAQGLRSEEIEHLSALGYVAGSSSR